jgi:hypothetical protein
VVIEDHRGTVGTVDSPRIALPLRPHVSYKEDEPVDEAEFRSERKIGLELFASAFRDIAQPPGKRLPANFPGKSPEQTFPDGPGTVVRFIPHGKAERAAGLLVLFEFLGRADKCEAPALIADLFVGMRQSVGKVIAKRRTELRSRLQAKTLKGSAAQVAAHKLRWLSDRERPLVANQTASVA